MGEIIFGSVAAVCLCAFVGVGCWVLYQDWKKNGSPNNLMGLMEEGSILEWKIQNEKLKKILAQLETRNDEEEDSRDSLDDLEDEVRLLTLKYKSEQLKRKLKEEFGITMVYGDRPDPKKTPAPKESDHKSDESSEV